MSQPTFKDIEKLLRGGEFAGGTMMSHAANVARSILLNQALSIVDAGASIAIKCKNGAVVRYVWDQESRGWQATI